MVKYRPIKKIKPQDLNPETWKANVDKQVTHPKTSSTVPNNNKQSLKSNVSEFIFCFPIRRQLYLWNFF